MKNCVLIAQNNYVDICAKACACCWDKPVPTTFEDKLTYIGKRVKIGHNSILEHSNIVLLIKIKKKEYNSVIKFLSYAKFLNVKTREDKKYIYLLIGGSIRAYKSCFDMCEEETNKVLDCITSFFYTYSFKELFIDFIDKGIFDENLFLNVNSLPSSEFMIDYERFCLVNIDSINFKPLQNIFIIDDLLDMISVTILFKNVSRACTAQITRHRNAITQESQRYVDYSKSNFISPDIFNEKLKNNEYEINLNGSIGKYTLDKLGEELINIYAQLREQGMLKEDCRAFLPMNTACNKLYMTFTLRNLLHFLHLRTDRAAQAEIRNIAIEMETQLKEKISILLNIDNSENIYDVLLPEYEKRNKGYIYKEFYEQIDEVIISEDELDNYTFDDENYI